MVEIDSETSSLNLLTIDQQLKDTYKNLNVINKGTSSLVKKGRNRETKEYYAIKILPKKKTTIYEMENYSNFS
jgi:serine/threonine protein kinase